MIDIFKSVMPGNTFFESEIVIEGGENDEIDETNPRVMAIRAEILLKQE